MVRNQLQEDTGPLQSLEGRERGLKKAHIGERDIQKGVKESPRGPYWRIIGGLSQIYPVQTR